LHSTRNAIHPINAMLNYAYGVLESHVSMQVVLVGLDPAVGILHGSARGQHGLMFDLMEPLRPIVDRKVLKSVQSRTFHSADFTLSNTGLCRLNLELARNLVRAAALSISVVHHLDSQMEN
jgi:CRISPR-associated protein Cas1